MSSAVTHRLWPLPRRPWLVAMTWLDLLFMHWPVRPEALLPHVPRAVPLDTFEGSAWVGIVPFMMKCTRLRGMPPLPGLSSFPELNVRTYVTVDGKPGVYFFSLDAAQPVAVAGARLTFGLPYFHADMACATSDAGWIDYHSDRADRRAPRATLDARYRPVGDACRATPGSLDHFLTERYALYTVDRRGRPLRGDIHHQPWPLQPAECDATAVDMTRLMDLTLPDIPPLLHFSRRLDVVAWLPRQASG